MAEQTRDFLAITTLDGDITDSALSLDVVDASLFPSSGDFDIRIGNELLKVTAVTGDTFTVVRAQGTPATTAAAHLSGAVVKIVFSRRALLQVIQDALTALGLGSAAFADTGDFDVAGAAAAAQAASQPLDTDLSAIAALVSAADKIAYATGAGTWAFATLTSFIRTLLDDADAATARGTLGIAYPSGVVTLTDGATISVNATLGDVFKVTLGGNRTLSNPTGAVDGQRMTFRIRQDGTGSRTLTLDTKFRLGTDLTSTTLTTTVDKTDYLGVIYHATDDKFDVVAFVKGF